MAKLKMHTPDLVADNLDWIAARFPGCITESRNEKGEVVRAVDFDLLRQELSTEVVEGPQERYHLNWPGKREALLAANAPIAKTLRPCREESVDFDTTRNLFIEGDNLDALKLLQETYLNKIKMIYIDPPYNSGKDFLYADDFSISFAEYLVSSGQGDDGTPLVTNAESNGRFHSAWLTALFPRLRVARTLLSDDGVLFVSINDIEFHNLRKLCDEVFGETCFLGCVVWKNATDNNPSQIAVEHEYVLVYCRNRDSVAPVWQTSVSDVKDLLVRKGRELLKAYPDHHERQEAYTAWFRQHKPELWPLDGYKHIDGGGIYAGIRGVHNPGKEGYRYDVLHPVTGKPCKEPLMGYRFPKETMDRLLAEDRIIFGDDHTKLIELKAYAHDYQEKLSSVFELDGRSAAYDLRELFPEYKTAFKNPKPVKLLQRFIPLILKNDGDIILDFYAGSSTAAQATMEVNWADGVARRFVMIQMNEPCNPDSEPAKNGVETISQLSKERIRRAGRCIQERVTEQAKSVDIGFRSFKVASTNLKDVYYRPDEATPDLLTGHVDNIKADRSDEDLLFQVLLDWGIDLSLPIATETIAGKSVLFVDTNGVAACFEEGIDEEFVKELARREPLRAVFRDAGYSGDDVKINVEQIFKQLSPRTEIRTL